MERHRLGRRQGQRSAATSNVSDLRPPANASQSELTFGSHPFCPFPPAQVVARKGDSGTANVSNIALDSPFERHKKLGES